MFNGFQKEFVDYFVQLSFDNTNEKQAENLKSYMKLVSNPLNDLYNDLLPVVCEINPTFETKPARCISTPYTDRRFSPNTPLKEYMYLRFKQSNKTKDIVGLYFDMGADMYSYGLRVYKQTAVGFQRMKDNIIDNQDRLLKELNIILDNGYEIIGDTYKKDHYPEINNKLLNDFLNRKNFYICKDCSLNDDVFTPKLAEEISQGFLQLKDFVNLIL